MSLSLLTNDSTLNKVLIATYLSHMGLLILFIVTCLTNEDHSWKLWVFQSLPLLIVIPGILKKHYRAHSWLCFIILAYFTAYVAEVGSPLAEPTDWVGLSLSVIVFIGAMISSRQLQRLNPNEEPQDIDIEND